MARKGRRRAKGRAVRELGLGGGIGGGLGGGRTGGVGEGSLSREGGSWEDGRVSLALLHARCVPNVDILKVARKKAFGTGLNEALLYQNLYFSAKSCCQFR